MVRGQCLDRCCCRMLRDDGSGTGRGVDGVVRDIRSGGDIVAWSAVAVDVDVHSVLGVDVAFVGGCG